MKEKQLNLKETKRYLRKSKKMLASASTFNKANFFETGNTPFCLVKGDGAYTWDVDRNKYIDYVIGLGTMTLGHNHPEVNAAIRMQLKNGISFSLPTQLEIDVAEMIIKRIPCAEKVKFAKNGNDVTSAAVRLARYHTKRDHILLCGYHGWQDWYIAQTSKNAGIPECVKSLSHRFLFNDIDSLHKLLNKHKNNVACIILEPIPAREMPRAGFLQELRDIATKHGIVLIFDEIVTGFRFHKGGAQALLGIKPDLACFSKAIANGMPLAVLTGKEEIMSKFADVYFSITNAGETLSLAAAKAVMNFYDRVDVPGRLADSGKKLREGLIRLIAKHRLSERMRVVGHDCRFGVEFINANKPGYDPSDDLIFWVRSVTSEGILSSGWHMLSYAHDNSVIEETIKKYETVFAKVGGTFLKG